jgi:hypothetical protein
MVETLTILRLGVSPTWPAPSAEPGCSKPTTSSAASMAVFTCRNPGRHYLFFKEQPRAIGGMKTVSVQGSPTEGEDEPGVVSDL